MICCHWDPGGEVRELGVARAVVFLGPFLCDLGLLVRPLLRDRSHRRAGIRVERKKERKQSLND